MKHLLLFPVMITFITTVFARTPSSAELTDSTDHGPLISAGFRYTGDLVSNLSGGIRKGATYLGLANVSLEFNPEKAGLWQIGRAHV